MPYIEIVNDLSLPLFRFPAGFHALPSRCVATAPVSTVSTAVSAFLYAVTDAAANAPHAQVVGCVHALEPGDERDAAGPARLRGPRRAAEARGGGGGVWRPRIKMHATKEMMQPCPMLPCMSSLWHC